MSLGDRARNTLLKCGRIIAAHYGYELATVAERAYGDRRFFAGLAEGQNLTFKKYDEVAWFLRGHWPHGVEWPSRGTFDPPEPSEVKAFMAKLPKKRRLIAPRLPPQERAMKKSNPSPVPDASRATKPAPTHSALPPFVEGVGDSLGQEEHQG